MRPAVRAVLRAATLSTVVLTGCTQPPPPPVVVPTIPITATTTVPPTTPPPPTVPATCAQMVAGDQLDTVLGVPVSGVVERTRGEPVPDIGRTARTTCRYGRPSPERVYPVVISVTSYGSAEEAAARVSVTVAEAEGRGVGSSRVPTGGSDGLFVRLPEGPLVVASSGIFSVAVSLAPKLLPPDQAGAKGSAVAGIVLANAGV